MKRQPALHQRPADQLVERIVAAHILPRRQQAAFAVEQGGGVQATRPVEDALRFPQPGG